jgi:mycothiol synthase
MAWYASSDRESLAGFCWIKREIAGEGEIYVIAVDPAYQGRGIGRALVVDGIGRMESAGDRLVFLYTDANNTAGLTLYRSLGFYLDHVDRSFVRVL